MPITIVSTHLDNPESGVAKGLPATFRRMAGTGPGKARRWRVQPSVQVAETGAHAQAVRSAPSAWRPDRGIIAAGGSTGSTIWRRRFRVIGVPPFTLRVVRGIVSASPLASARQHRHRVAGAIFATIDAKPAPSLWWSSPIACGPSSRHSSPSGSPPMVACPSLQHRQPAPVRRSHRSCGVRSPRGPGHCIYNVSTLQRRIANREG